MFEIFTMFFLQGQELGVNVTDNIFFESRFHFFPIFTEDCRETSKQSSTLNVGKRLFLTG